MSSCGAETHLFFSGHSAIDASDTSARAAPGVWSARWPASPKGRIESEPRGLSLSQLRGVRGVARIEPFQLKIATFCHGLKVFVIIFLVLVILAAGHHFRARMHLPKKKKKKKATWNPAQINETEPRPVLVETAPTGSQAKSSTGGALFGFAYKYQTKARARARSGHGGAAHKTQRRWVRGSFCVAAHIRTVRSKPATKLMPLRIPSCPFTRASAEIGHIIAGHREEGRLFPSVSR